MIFTECVYIGKGNKMSLNDLKALKMMLIFSHGERYFSGNYKIINLMGKLFYSIMNLILRQYNVLCTFHVAI